MPKKLIALRLPESAIKIIKELAVSEGITQADLVISSIALFQSFSLYKRELLGVEKHAESVVAIQERSGFL